MYRASELKTGEELEEMSIPLIHISRQIDAVSQNNLTTAVQNNITKGTASF